MNGCLEAPSQMVLQYATLGVAPRRRAPPPSKESHWNKPCKLIYRLSQRCKNVVNKVETREEEDQKPDLTELDRCLNRRPRSYYGVAPQAVVQNAGDQSAHLSDVFDVISAHDPTFVDAAAPAQRNMAAPAAYAFITEQPAPKGLRFRYECEGRSAGSILGRNSSGENKTFPTIKVAGYNGCFIVVVSCVTKDEPYKPHPHNLVGRDCAMGVCTVKEKTDPDQDGKLVTFKNLGIQCVKRRDIPEALRIRQEMRVNPFKTGYGHRSQPQSIDLNAVRLCFQVFLTDDSYKVLKALPPFVSEVVYDKKAMSDLHIARASHCTGSARGGTTIILLCEKVTREDTEVWFYREENGGIVWQDRGHIEFVHKQLAIVLKTPPYADPHTQEHVTVLLQLHRISDGAKSNAFNFEYFPEAQGTAARKPLPDLADLAALLAGTRTSPADPPHDPNNNRSSDKEALVSSTSDSLSVNVSDESGTAVIANGTEAEPEPEPDSNERALDDLLDQVAELDEIYTENRTRLENITSLNRSEEEDFDDAGTYTSLQLAFKNPVSIVEPELPYEDVQVQHYRGPIVEFAPLKRDTDDDKAPPLPPKRVRKVPSTEPFKTSQTSVDSILKPGKPLPVTRNPEALKRDRAELSVARSEPALPPVKKRSFFSRLFRRKEKSPAPSVKSEGQKEKKSKPVGRSVSSVSGLRPSKFKSSVSHTSLKDNASGAGLSYADSITHISLHGDGEDDKSTSQTSLRRPASLAPLPPTDGGTILVAESVLALDASAFKKLQDDLDLTDAEHYALYMAVAPHATVSEFDETSCYYSPVDGSKFHNQN